MTTDGPRLARFAVFEGADPAAIARAEHVARWRDYDAGEVVLDFDSPSADVRFVAAGGPLRVLMRTSGGREKTVGEVVLGDFFGELAAIAGPAAPPSAGVVAVHRVRLCELPGAAFMDIVLASPVVARRVMTALAERVRAQNRRLLEYSALSVRHRLIAEILRMARPRSGGEGLTISPPPLRADLASRIGARREAVSRLLADLARQGLLAVGPRAIAIPDASVLQREVEDAMAAAKPLD